MAPALGAIDGPLSGRVRRVLDRPSHVRSGLRRRFVAWALALMRSAGVGAAVWPRHGVSQATQAAGRGAAQNTQASGPATAGDWQVTETEHFEIRYGAALANEIDRVEEAAERAYPQVSGRLAEDLSFKVPLLLFATREEFERQGFAPGANLSSFAEPTGHLVVVLVEEWGDDLVQRLAHELTHVFAFEAIPRSDPGVSVPLWFDEGLADYAAGTWSDSDQATLRGLVASGDLPAMSTAEGHAGFENPRVVYALGHAAFDFVEARSGQAAVGAFMHALGSGGSGPVPYLDALGMTPAAFDVAFSEYLRRRFAPSPDAPGR